MNECKSSTATKVCDSIPIKVSSVDDLVTVYSFVNLCTFIIIIIISPALLFCVQSCDDDEEDDTDDGDVTIHFKCRCNYSSHALRLVNSTLTATVVKTKSVVTQDTRHCVRRQRR